MQLGNFPCCRMELLEMELISETLSALKGVTSQFEANGAKRNKRKPRNRT